MRNYLSYNIISVFPCEIENIFFKILLPNSKPVTVKTIYRPPSQNNFLELLNSNSPVIYLLKVKNRNFRTRCEICSKLTIKIPERRQWRRSGIFIVNFEHISYLTRVFLLSTLYR